MEPATAGALYTTESLLEGTVVFAQGITHPTPPLRASFSHITSTPPPRTGHPLRRQRPPLHLRRRVLTQHTRQQ